MAFSTRVNSQILVTASWWMIDAIEVVSTIVGGFRSVRSTGFLLLLTVLVGKEPSECRARSTDEIHPSNGTAFQMRGRHFIDDRVQFFVQCRRRRCGERLFEDVWGDVDGGCFVEVAGAVIVMMHVS